MKKLLLTLLAIQCAWLASAQITITQADYGQAGDSIVVGYDDAPPASTPVGGTGMQTWDFTMLSLNNINTLNFVDPVNTTSGSEFPNADLAIERQNDTLFFQSNASEFVVDGFAGAGFGFPVNIVADFNPNSTQIEFPSTLNSSFTDTAIFDTIVGCAEYGFGSTCDSARLRRVLIATSTVDAYGTLSTPGGTYQTVRQYFKEDNKDTLWIKTGFFGWIQFFDSASTGHNYRWIANGEKWPVMTARADAAGGDITSAEYLIGAQVLGFASSEVNPSCNGGCDGSAAVFAVGGLPPYSYAWPGGETTASVTGLCAGNYQVTITDSDTGSYVVEVILIDPSPVTINGAVQGVNTVDDGAIDITVSGGAGNYSYAWTGPDGFTATTQDISGLATGSYTVVATDNKGCDTNRTFLVELTGLSTPVSGGFKLFPNPANAQLTLVSNQQIERYRIMDLLGNLLLTAEPGTNVTEVATMHYAAGIYMIEVNTVSGNYLTKFTIRH